MAEHNQFGSVKPGAARDAEQCLQFDSMLADALDETLSTADQAAFDRHMTGCMACSMTLADARRGAAWLEMLRDPRPEPRADLLERILAQTTGAEAARSGVPASIAGIQGMAGTMDSAEGQFFGGAKVIPFRSRPTLPMTLRGMGRTLLQPRLAMTAAMAFFSVALTLNLTGVRLSDLHAADLRPSTIKRNVVQGGAHMVRYYDNLVVVYELESRVRELQRSADSDAGTSAARATENDAPTTAPAAGKPAKPETTPQPKQVRPKTGTGTSRREDPHESLHFVARRAHEGTNVATPILTADTTAHLKCAERGEQV